jgi:hypothetical protein
MRNHKRIKTITKLSDYRTTDAGILMAYKAEESGTQYIISKIIINPPIDESIFRID